jgi:hypothetical protein
MAEQMSDVRGLLSRVRICSCISFVSCVGISPRRLECSVSTVSLVGGVRNEMK